MLVYCRAPYVTIYEPVEDINNQYWHSIPTLNERRIMAFHSHWCRRWIINIQHHQRSFKKEKKNFSFQYYAVSEEKKISDKEGKTCWEITNKRFIYVHILFYGCIPTICLAYFHRIYYNLIKGRWKKVAKISLYCWNILFFFKQAFQLEILLFYGYI